MGLFKMSVCDCGCKSKEQNPDPINYHIVGYCEVCDYVSVIVNYPNCTNFEGNKIMVYKSSIEEIMKMKKLDPHFCDNGHLSPIARFRPTRDGEIQAVKFMKMLSEG